MQKKRFSVRDDRLQDAIGSLLQEQDLAGEGRLENLPVNLVFVSSSNPRYIGRISPQDIIQHREGLLDLNLETGERKNFFKGITEIAQSIDRRGLLQPIVVKEDANGFTIMVGERRYLAHLLLGRERIRAIVRPHSEELEERSVRLIENLQREDLSFPEIIRAIEELDHLFQAKTGRPMDSQDLAAELHKHDSTCRRYLQIVRSPNDVREAVEQGKILGLRPALALLEIESREDRGKALEKFGGNDATEALIRSATQAPQALPQDVGETKRRGRRRQQINLGGVKKILVVRHIMQSIMGQADHEERYGSLDWSNFDLVQETWDSFLRELEQDLTE